MYVYKYAIQFTIIMHPKQFNDHNIINHKIIKSKNMDSPGRIRQGSKLSNLEIDLVAPTKTYQNTCLLTAIIICLCFSSFYFGFSLTYLSSVQPNTLKVYFGNAAGKASTIGGLIGGLPIGAAVGALCAPIFMKLFSRKNFLLFFNAIAILLAGIIQINNIILLFVIRLITGFLIGNYMAITPIYISQLAPLQIQGSYGAFTQLFVVTALVTCYLLGVIFTVTGVDQGFVWRFLFSFTGLTALIQSILLIFNFIPESPVSLIEKGQIQQAKKVLGKFNTPEVLNKVLQQTIIKVNANTNTQLDETQMQSPQQKINKSKTQAIQKQQIILTARALFLGFQLPFMQQLSGTNMIVTEIGSVVQQYDQNLALYAPLVSNIVQLIATALSVLLLVYFGRRSLMLTGNFLLALFDIVIAVMFLILPSWQPAVYVALAFIMLFMLVYGLTIGPVVWLYVPEIIPAKYVPPATFMNWLGCSICVIGTPFVIQAVGSSYPVFFFFGGISLIFAVINFFLIIETKGLTASEISKKFSSN